MLNRQVDGKVIPGYQIASGQTDDSPYPDGSIVLQKKYFRERGLNIDHCFNGTLNIDIAPKTFRLIAPLYTFEKVKWIKGFPAETFSFASCTLMWQAQNIEGFVYYPHPETKTQHFHSAQRIEVLAPYIEGINYGDCVTLGYDEQQIQIL